MILSHYGPLSTLVTSRLFLHVCIKLFNVHEVDLYNVIVKWRTLELTYQLWICMIKWSLWTIWSYMIKRDHQIWLCMIIYKHMWVYMILYDHAWSYMEYTLINDYMWSIKRIIAITYNYLWPCVINHQI